MKKIIFLLLVSAPFLMGSSEAQSEGTDILQRTINFMIFAGIIWFFVADKVKAFFSDRANAIAQKLESVQEKLKESKRQKQLAQEKILDAKRFAEELLESSKKENKIIADEIHKQCEQDIIYLGKQSADLMDFEQRSMVRTVVNEVMSEMLSSESEMLDKDAIANIIMKKVA